MPITFGGCSWRSRGARVFALVCDEGYAVIILALANRDTEGVPAGAGGCTAKLFI